jgi:hypothetical protein
MRTRPTITRAHKRNPHLARLDRAIRRHGEDMEIWFGTAAATIKPRVNIRGMVRTLGIEQLIGNVQTTKYVIIISPNDLRRAHHQSGTVAAVINPGSASAGAPSGVNPDIDRTLPVATSTQLYFRGTQKVATRIDAIYHENECVRIEMFV